MDVCPNCGKELISEVIGSSVLVRCPCCDFSVATSYMDPIFEDSKQYELFLDAGNKVTGANYSYIQFLTNKNIREIKSIFENAPYLLFKGRATEVKEIRDKLDENGIKYYIVPEFNY